MRHIDTPPERATLPSRYGGGIQGLYRRAFDAEVSRFLRPGMTILDVGAGNQPAVRFTTRPEGSYYAALDIDREALDSVEPGRYDEVVVGDVTRPHPQLRGRFDLVVSLYLLEHVSSVPAAVKQLRNFLKPGGVLVAQLAGRRSVSGLLNRAIPHGLAVALLRLLTGRPPGTIVPAHYDNCTFTGLRSAFAGWSQVTIQPQFTGAHYFAFSPVALRPYLALEDWLWKSRRADSATWYLVTARP